MPRLGCNTRVLQQRQSISTCRVLVVTHVCTLPAPTRLCCVSAPSLCCFPARAGQAGRDAAAVTHLLALPFAVRCLFAASAADCRATRALFRAPCESVVLSCSESVLLSCSTSPSWPSRSRCRVSVVTHLLALSDRKATAPRQSFSTSQPVTVPSAALQDVDLGSRMRPAGRHRPHGLMLQ